MQYSPCALKFVKYATLSMGEALGKNSCVLPYTFLPKCHFLQESRMSLDADEVAKIAHLARLAIEEKDVPEYATNLSNILELVEQMSTVDTQGVEAMAHPLELPQRLREDEVIESNQREQFQECAPKVERGLYLVPQVIE
jgi:aspartyl-tRNA(Asn)/glutamyl-tRNA(Gln) amidotransferase subunit C